MDCPFSPSELLSRKDRLERLWLIPSVKESKKSVDVAIFEGFSSLNDPDSLCLNFPTKVRGAS